MSQEFDHLANMTSSVTADHELTQWVIDFLKTTPLEATPLECTLQQVLYAHISELSTCTYGPAHGPRFASSITSLGLGLGLDLRLDLVLHLGVDLGLDLG